MISNELKAVIVVTTILLILTINFYRNLWTLKMRMRELWSEHVWWTREFLIATLVAAPNADVAATRLMQNQDHIGTAYGAYFGKDRGAALATLLKEHISVAVEVVSTLNTPALEAAVAKWYANADDITRFMSKDGVDLTMPVFSSSGLADQKSMMSMHLASTTAEVVALAGANFQAAVTTFETVLHEAMMMADMMSREIAHVRMFTFATTVGKLPCCV